MEAVIVDINSVFKTDPDRAFKLIYDQLYEGLCMSAFQMVRSVDASKDIVQEVIMELWRKRETLEITASIQSYLHRSVHNRSINFLKAKANNLGDLEDVDMMVDEPSNNQQLLDAELLSERIGKEIDALPEKCKIVFTLSRYEEKSYKEIADMMDISVKTVENHISKALKILRKNLSYG